jgi:hypothetical protein
MLTLYNGYNLVAKQVATPQKPQKRQASCILGSIAKSVINSISVMKVIDLINQKGGWTPDMTKWIAAVKSRFNDDILETGIISHMSTV